MSVVNSSELVTSSTRGGGEGASGAGGSSNAGAVLSISPTPVTHGDITQTSTIRSRSNTSSSLSILDRNRDDSIPPAQQSQVGGAVAYTRTTSNSITSQSPSPDPVLRSLPATGPAPAVTSSAAASFPLYANTNNPSSISTRALAASAGSSDASTYTDSTNITAHGNRFTPPSPLAGSSSSSSSPSSLRLSFPFSSPFSSCRTQVASPSTIPDSFSPPVPPKSPRTFLPLSNTSQSSLRSAAGPFPFSFMGSGQSKPSPSPTASSSTPLQSQQRPQRLQKPSPHAAVSSASTSTTVATASTTGQLAVPSSASTRSASPSPSSLSPPPRSHSPNPRISPLVTSNLPGHTSSSSSKQQQTQATPISTTGSFGSSATSRLKRAFAGRRKKSEDPAVFSTTLGNGGSSASLEQHNVSTRGGAAAIRSGPAASSKGAGKGQLASIATSTLGGSDNAKKALKTQVATSPPPPPPPKERVPPLHLQSASMSSLTPSPDAGGASNKNRASIIQLSPGISSAVDFMRELQKEDEEENQSRAGDSNVLDGGQQVVSRREKDCRTPQQPKFDLQPQSTAVSSPTPISPAAPSSTPPTSRPIIASLDKEKERDQREKGEMKEVWRKSDSTIGHHTIRAAVAGTTTTKTSRPVSMAESFQSAYTIVPSGAGGPGSTGGNKRWSTLTGDLDFGAMMEEDGEEDDRQGSAGKGKVSTGGVEDVKGLSSSNVGTSPASSIKKQNRRSISLNLGIGQPPMGPAYVNITATSHTAVDAESRPLVYSISEGQSGAILPPQPSHLSNTGGRGSSAPTTRMFPHQRYPGPHASAQSSSLHNAPHSVAGLRPQSSIPQEQYASQSQQGQPSALSSTGSSSNLRGRFNAWTSGSSSSNTGSAASPAPRNANLSPPSMAPQSNTSQSHGSQQSMSLRQTAISMTGGLGPAAGLAKRAAEKLGGIGKKWGISTSSSGSGYSSSSSSRDVGSHSSSHSHMDQYGHGMPIGRTDSNQSSLASSMKSGNGSLSSFGTGVIHHVQLPGKDKSKDRKNRRTPNAPSGAYSVTSSITSGSTSESDGMFPPSGPNLGKMVRGPMKNRHGGTVVGGVVFGRELKAVVEQTRAVIRMAHEQEPTNRKEGDRERMVKDLESRYLPALVVRCAQHILIWGIQEEGLFRVSGRASHVSKLRSEFDTGVDYDLTDCAPGDLDPHAVASIFKAYLRELPEPILTKQLQPLFEAALSQELASYPPGPVGATKITTRPTGLPSGPKSGFVMPLRKPPSLSTLAMPSFNGMPPASQTLLNTLRAFVSELPRENRDLILTVVELIAATAKASKETKMPLSNLLLVFCPSLNMSPPLLKALCESEGIWEPLEDTDEVVDIRRSTIVLDISAETAARMDRSDEPPEEEDDEDEDDDESFSDAGDGVEAESQSVQSLDPPPSDHLSSEYNASAESSLILDETDHSRRRPHVPDRREVPTLYLDSVSRFSSPSVSSAQEVDEHAGDAPADGESVPYSSRRSVGDWRDAHSLTKQPSNVELPQITEDVALATQRDAPQSPKKQAAPIDVTSVRFPSEPSPATPNKRRSIPILSLPTFSPLSTPAIHDPPSPTSGPANAGLRGKKPSLRRLFTRSAASLNSNSGSSNPRARASIPLQSQSPATGNSPYSPPTPLSVSDSSVSTPLSAVTAPQSSTSLLPPVLDTHIEGSSFRLELGFDISPPRSADDLHSQRVVTANTETSLYGSALSSQACSQASLQSSFTSTKGDRLDHRSPYRQRLVSSTSTASSNHLELPADEDEDWTQSVLAAAGQQASDA